MKKIAVFIVMLTCLMLLSGCMYPESERAENQTPYEEQMINVQNAVNQYRGASGNLLPIKTRDMDVDQYIKYPIDFSKIVPAHMAEVPPNAFEAGGIFQYVLMDVEENPTVKLVDLRIAEAIRTVNIRKSANGGKMPISEIVAENVYKFNHEAMGMSEEPTVVSPYSGRNLPLVTTGQGDIYVDYSMDLYSAIQEYDGELKEGEDIRFLLYEKNPVVPAYSLPYTIDENQEPVFNNK
ncbi:hypothetical protein QWY14_04910 [Planococcus sp. N028]|uniref:Uncharacterized protein n=1 Tax=Planococcus shixiaomingii TaxID=3058393 RepID=A0ABT8N0A4_9BACL|nr:MULTISPECIES: hypothetical protein [unclassified Planococcus (in: firmicutes)]MDN7241117.1 hypothetical protein [Planococcus sp. N028]WKA53369.1 hypothetical protein QWY21_11930 [Planococcus sp. N022]